MRHYLLLLLLPSYYMAQGQNTDTDTIPVRELGEITVTAETQRAEATKTIYLPTGRQKDSASDGITLLAHMNIPQLSVNPVSETIKTVDGQGISMFINFHPATAEDVAGLNPSVVKRVEYMNSPIDPRFLRAQHVVNIITHEYAYGGYTKLNGKERWLIHSGNASVYSKFVYGQMEYDVMLSCDYDYNPHTGTTNDESYKFATGSIVRESGTETGRYHERGLFAGLRTSWNKKQNISFRNLVSYRKNHIPVNETSGYLRFSQLYPSESFSSESLVKSSSLGWGSELYASMNKGWSISGNFNAEILNSKTADNYKTEVSSIINHANEDSWFFRGNVQANKSLSDRISLFINTLSGVGHTNIKYTGTSNAENRFRQTFIGIYLGVALNYKKMSGSIDGGYAFESNHINDKRTYDRYPFTHINVQYVPDRKNTISLWLQYATISPDAVMKNPNVIQQSELMYITGNSDLKASRHIIGNIGYTLIFSNNWQISAYASLFRIISRQIEVYSPDGPGGAMLRKYQNDGDYNHGQIGAQLIGKFFGGKLSVSIAPRLLLYRITGSNSMSHYPFIGSVKTDYYAGNFFFNAYWGSRSSYVDGETSYFRKMPSEYSIGAGWASRGWNIQVIGTNLFRSSWLLSKDILRTGWYDSLLTRYGSDFHRSICINITYTLNYGKKINKSIEINGDSDISNSILR